MITTFVSIVATSSILLCLEAYDFVLSLEEPASYLRGYRKAYQIEFFTVFKTNSKMSKTVKCITL